MKRSDLAKLLKSLRPQIIAYFQDIEIEQYKLKYNNRHGRDPTQEEINQFISILIDKSIVKDKVDKIISDLLNEYKRVSIRYLITKSVFFIPSLYIYSLYAIAFLKNKGYNFADDSFIFQTIYFIITILLIIFTLFLYTQVIMKEFKRIK